MLQSVICEIVVNVRGRVVKLVEHLHAYFRTKDERVYDILKSNVVRVLNHYLPIVERHCDDLRNNALIRVL